MTIPGHHPSTCKQMPHSLDKTYLLGPYAGSNRKSRGGRGERREEEGEGERGKKGGNMFKQMHYPGHSIAKD